MTSTTTTHHQRSATAATRLADLPAELIGRLLSAGLAPPDLAAANAASSLFRGAPGGRSPVEHALRERARARGHARALPTELPAGVRSWTEELFARESVLVLASEHASPVAAGHSFSAFVDAEGGLHTCGEEGELDEDGHWFTGEYGPHVALGHVRMSEVLVPTRIASLCAVRVCSVASGCAHLLALSDAGTVYGCGDNDNGQLGLGDTRTRRSFAPIDVMRGTLVACIGAGAAHSLALTAAGCAYSWGDNQLGQLGHGDTEQRWEPTRIEALDGVRVGGMSVGRYHTLLLSVDGTVYSFGDGYYGRLGHGDEQHQHTPRRIEALAGVRAVHVSAGCEHSLVVDAAGGVHAFGYGHYAGQLGPGCEPFECVPRCIPALAGVRAVRACAGMGGSAVLGADGSVHTFGDNRYGLLGHTTTAVSASSGRVGALAHVDVVGCALGDTHALFVTADGSVYSCGQQSAALGQGVSMAARAGLLRTPTRIQQLPRMGAPLASPSG